MFAVEEAVLANVNVELARFAVSLANRSCGKF